MEKMRPLLCSAAVVLVLAACSSSTGPATAASIAGTWSGTISQTNPVLTYPLSVVLTSGQGGTTTYGAPVNCGGTLTPAGVSGNTYTYSEHITSGIANCVDGGRVQATLNGNSLAWVWTLPVNPMPGDTDRTTLTRQ